MWDVILDKYQVRKSNREKNQFIEYIKIRLKNAGYEENDITIEEKGKGLLKSRNIVVGDVEDAKVVLTAHYDTCAVLPFPNFMAPTNLTLFVISQVVVTFIIIAIAFLCGWVITLISGDTTIGASVTLLSFYVLLFHMLFGYRNKHTANDNTSGVVAITRILENLSPEDRKKVCVVYFDNEEKGLLGSEFFKKKHKDAMKEKFLVNMDCVGDGRNVVVLTDSKMKNHELCQKLLTVMQEYSVRHDVKFIHSKLRKLMFPSDQLHFAKGIGVCTLRDSSVGMYVARIHTPLDTVCRRENIEYLRDSIQHFIRML